MFATFKVTGLDSVVIELNALKPKLSMKVWDEIKESAKRVQAGAKMRAPVAKKVYYVGRGSSKKKVYPGSLKKNIKRKLSQAKMQARVTYLGPGWYGKFSEFGTQSMPAKPYLGPAAAAERPVFIHKVSKITKVTVKNAKV